MSDEDKFIDLDALGAARREAKKNAPKVRFGGRQFQLPSEMPFAVIEAVGQMQGEDGEIDSSLVARSMADIARALFGKEYRQFLDLGPSGEDITALLEHIAPAYGLKVEETTAE